MTDQPAPRIGRPTKLTPETQATICDAIGRGMYYHHAAALAGVSYDAFNEWMNAGQRAEDAGDAAPELVPYRQFRQAVKQAEAADVARRLARIDRVAEKPGQFMPDVIMLSKRHRAEYGMQDVRVEHTGQAPQVLVVQYNAGPAPELPPGVVDALSSPGVSAAIDARAREHPHTSAHAREGGDDDLG